ncbi:hypothetical protein C6502_19455 [Candidatus Poribacteria bacterium]|nr:MAG: hypothetical protein C6502_19455 [Candidatus Poribacteria bacterium]
MSVKFTDPQLQLLHDSIVPRLNSIESRLESVEHNITVMNNSINRLKEDLDSRSELYDDFMNNTRRRLHNLERKTDIATDNE